jgi:ubiquitin carboxyl-terminal hydrolase 4/11
VAKAYANLLSQIYSEASSGTFSPTQFKRVIARWAPSFSGYGQQDSQEFLLFLLDGLQEDLNRIKNKPYIEKPDSTDEMVQNPTALKELADQSWDIYKARNDSVISDLFAGMYKSTVICPVCDKVSIIFDPFTNLTLQLPIENNWSKKIFYFPLHGPPIMIDVDIDKNANFSALKEYVAKRVGSDPARLIGAEMYKRKFYKMFDNTTTVAEHNIQNADEVAIYEVEAVPTNYDPNKQKRGSGLSSLSNNTKHEIPDLDTPGADRVLIPLFQRLAKIGGTRRGSFFGFPSYIILTRHEAKSYDEILRKALGNVANLTTKQILLIGEDDMSSMITPEDSDTVVMNDDDTISSDSHVKVESVEGEDGLVDVSMKDANGSAQDTMGRSQSRLPSVLKSGAFIPPMLQNLFEMKVYKSDVDAIPLGWSSLEDNKELVSISERSSRRERRRAKYEAESGSTSSEEGLPARMKSDDSDNRSDMHVSGSESDTDLPSVQKIFSTSKMPFNRKSKQTYSKKNRKSAPGGAFTPPLDEEGWLVRPGEAIVLDWNESAYDSLFEGDTEGDEMRGTGAWKELTTWPDEELAAKRAQRQTRRKNGVTLDECLDEFGRMETLSENNSWYCPRCKEHRQANKKFELWKVPDILVMHLKRFSSNRNFRDKLELHVDYPIEGLDLNGRVISNEEEKSMIYDLIAVDNHYGGLGGGHYTAVAQNFFNKEWYDYNGEYCTFLFASCRELTCSRFARLI